MNFEYIVLVSVYRLAVLCSLSNIFYSLLTSVIVNVIRELIVVSITSILVPTITFFSLALLS